MKQSKPSAPVEHGPEIELFTVQETAGILKLETKKVYGLIRGGALRSCRFGRAIRIHRPDLEEFIRLSKLGTMEGRKNEESP